MKYACNLIKDLLPLYHDEICSEESKQAIEEHFEECQECQEYYKKLNESDVVEYATFDEKMEEKKVESLKKVKKKLRKRDILFGIAAIFGAIIMALFWFSGGPVFILSLVLLGIGSVTAPIDVYTDVENYQLYMQGEQALEEFQSKWGMDETIFPEEITIDMDVQDFKMVYYNPWDAQYLGYLVVDYDAEDYQNEVSRLQSYESTDYLGNYGVTGFQEEYTLLAMYADDYQGFVYALTDNEDTIIYVELIFCNYFYDLEYEEYIPNEYLPVGFDATQDNAFRKEIMGE